MAKDKALAIIVAKSILDSLKSTHSHLECFSPKVNALRDRNLC